jgi:hypothetical protein
MTNMHKAIVVLAKTRQAGKLFYVLTAYPIP